jgi:SAM-dependent methyltransferase
MENPVHNSYEDGQRADAYAGLEFPGTYGLAYRDLPAVIRRHVQGTRALDFGCGTGRSTRFLGRLGFPAPVGVDISEAMVERARDADPSGDYRVLPEGDLTGLAGERFDLVLAVFTFDNIAGAGRRVALLRDLRELLAPGGRIIMLDSTPEIYTHEWASFTTRDFPDNAVARSGDVVRIVMTDVADRRPVEDILWTDADYRAAFAGAHLELLETHHPLGRAEDRIAWVSETRVAPWVIYVLQAAAPAR